MRVIKGAALGTYYAAGAEAARTTPNASGMRGLVYAVKDNRDPPNRPQPVAHPRHPAPAPVLVDRKNAVEYVTAIVARSRPRLAAFFGAAPEDITLVPVPSSEVTENTVDTARFPTLRLCRALAGVGLGTVRVLAVQRRAVAPKTTGNRRTADEILGNLKRTAVAVPRRGALVLVDDNVQRGASLAAVDKLLGASGIVAAFAVAVTDRRERADACQPRTFEVRYDPDATPLDVALSVR